MLQRPIKKRRLFKTGQLVLPRYHGATVKTFGIVLDKNISGTPEYYVYWFGRNIYNWQYSKDLIGIKKWVNPYENNQQIN
jgi:hypothetical protein